MSFLVAMVVFPHLLLIAGGSDRRAQVAYHIWARKSIPGYRIPDTVVEDEPPPRIGSTIGAEPLRYGSAWAARSTAHLWRETRLNLTIGSSHAGLIAPDLPRSTCGYRLCALGPKTARHRRRPPYTLGPHVRMSKNGHHRYTVRKSSHAFI